MIEMNTDKTKSAELESSSESVAENLTSAALSKKNDATKRFFCPAPPPPFQMPPKEHFMWVHASSTLRAFAASSLHFE